MRRILFIALHRPNRSPGQRFRFEQYLNFLKENNYDYDFSYLISIEDDKILYKPGNYLGKFKIFIKSILKRLRDVLKANKYDIIFIQREAFMTGTTLFERLFSKSKAKLIFDFDDSIWLQNVSEANKVLGWLKNADKTKDIIKVSDMIFAGNEYLASYASKYNSNIRIVPTTIDTDLYQRISVEKDDRICIGWSGSFSTIQHFEFAISSLREIKKIYDDKVYFKVIGDGNYYNEELGIKGLPWRANTELEDLSEIDIGIMPLPDDEWAKGKCGLKGLQYMALEIATVMSPVGVNAEIIKDGINGFLATDLVEWIDKIKQLIEDKDLRKRLGVKGRETVTKYYSVNSERQNYLKYFDQLLNS